MSLRPLWFVLPAVAMLATGCSRGSGTQASRPDSRATASSATEASPAPRETTLEQLSELVAVRRWDFRREEDAAVAFLILENRLAERTVSLQLSTAFTDSAANVLEETEWVSATIPPGRTFQYAAQSSNRRVAAATPRVRLLGDGTR